jgi:hypothetical protein
MFGARDAVATPAIAVLPGPEFTPALRWEFTMRIEWSNGRNPTGVYSAGQRIYNTAAGGEFAGTRVRGTVLPGGGDWATMNPPDARLDQPVEGRQVLFDARYILRTDDGVHIYVVNRGGKFSGHADPQDASAHPAYAISTPMFDVPTGNRYAFLVRNVYVAVSLARPKDTLLQLYRVAT